MDKLVAVLSKPSASIRKDDDFSDRLSSKYTVVVIVVFAVVVSMYSYTGKPITCWCPKHFPSSWKKYTNSYCWVKNTYYLEMEEEIPRDDEEHNYLLYYQWVPFILLAQACFFYLPNVIWHSFNQKSGIDADNILESVDTLEHTKNLEKRERMVQIITAQLDRFLRNRRPPDSTQVSCLQKTLHCLRCRWTSRRFSGYLVILFLFTKLLYITNVISQLFLLNLVFNTNYNTFGIDFFKDVQDEGYFANSPVFPRVTMCDFFIRMLGNLQRYTVQCVLPINLYTEKIYVFLWFWFVMVAACSVASFLMWTIRSLIWMDRHRFILNHIPADANSDYLEGEPMSHSFLNQYLKQDGAFLLRLMAHNTNNITTTEIISSLYVHWRSNVRGIQDDSGEDSDEEETSEHLV